PGPVLGSWGVTYPEALQGLTGSCVVIPCTFSYPSSVSASAGIVAIWYKDFDGQKTVVYHSAAQDEVDGRFRSRTRLLGDPAEHNCTLLLREVTTEDSGTYRFRFEIVNGDRVAAVSARPGRGRCADVPSPALCSASPDDPERPTTAANEEISEGAVSTFRCSTPYVCPFGSVALRWRGYNAQVSAVSTSVQLDTGGVYLRQTLNTTFSWKDHSKKLLCEVSLGSKKATGEVILVSPSCADPPRGPQVTLFLETQRGRLAIFHSPTEIRDVTLSDEGSYRFVATNAHGTVSHQRPEKGPRYPPHRLANPAEKNLRLKAFLETGEGPAVILACAVESNPPAELTLRRAGEVLAASPARGGAGRPEPNALRLELGTAVAAAAEGEYECRARSPLGSSRTSLHLRLQSESGGAPGRDAGRCCPAAEKGLREGQGGAFGPSCCLGSPGIHA
uniref:Sialic acid binding Ig like lectin 1 n=1 Tax=Apteryx owenii TaxID=8824 RepID=A0A8B9S9H6_APTOW